MVLGRVDVRRIGQDNGQIHKQIIDFWMFVVFMLGYIFYLFSISMIRDIVFLSLLFPKPMEAHSQDLCFWSWVSVPSQLNPLNGNLLNGILPFLPMMLGTGTVSFSTIPMALLVWEFSRIPTARFWILVFFATQLFEAAVLTVGWAQTKIGAETSGGFVACGFRSLKKHVNLSISSYRH